MPGRLVLAVAGSARGRVASAVVLLVGVLVAAGLAPVPPAGAADWTWGPPEAVVPGEVDGVPWIEAAVDGSDHATVSYRGETGMLASYTDEGWSAEAPFGTSASARLAPRIVESAAGDLTAVWVEHAPGTAPGTGDVLGAQRPAGGAWGEPRTLSTGPAGDDSVVLAGNEDGDVVAAWTEPGSVGQVRALVAPHGEELVSGSPVSAPTEDAAGPQVAMSEDGSAALLYGVTAVGSGQVRVQASRWTASAWSAGTPVTSTGDASSYTVAMDLAGTAIAVWQEADLDDAGLHSFSRRWPAGLSWEPALPLSADRASGPVALAFRPDGGAVAVWPSYEEDKSLMASAVGAASSTWSTPVALRTHAGEWGVELAAGSGGDMVATWTDDSRGSLVAARRRPDGSWTAPQVLSLAAVYDFDAAVDGSGHAVVVWAQAGATGTTVLRARRLAYDEQGPAAFVTAPSARFASSRSVRVAWRAEDDYSPIASYSVGYRSAPWNGTFGRFTPWLTGVGVRARTLAAAAGRTYCFTARADDTAANPGAWSAERCTTTPLDDRSLHRGRGWSRRTASGYYARTFVQSSRRGATLTRTGVRARRIALLVSTGRGYGKVSVRFAGRSLGTFSLARARPSRLVVLPVRTFPSVRSGTLRITVATARRIVRIDGVHLGR